MTPPALISLPGELIINIFQQFDTFTGLLALARTSRQYWSIWVFESYRISQNLLPRSTICFDDAEQLANAQWKSLACLDPPEETGLDYVKRIVLNARSAQFMCDQFTSIVMSQGLVAGKEGPYLTSDERTRFTHAFYNLWTFIYISNSSTTRKEGREFLATKDLREMYRLAELGLWLRKLLFFEIKHQPALNTAAEKFPSGADEYLKLSRWDWTNSELHRAWVRRIWAVAGNCRVRKPPNAPDGIFAVFDMWQNYVDMILED